MVKGLQRSLKRGAEIRQEVVRKTINISTTVTVAGASGVGFGTVALGALPEGNIGLLFAVAYLNFTGPGTGHTATWNGDASIGTTANADTSLTGAEVNVVDSTPIGPAVANVAPEARCTGTTQAIVDNTAANLNLNLNLLVDDADISANGVIFTVTGRLEIAYIVLSDD